MKEHAAIDRIAGKPHLVPHAVMGEGDAVDEMAGRGSRYVYRIVSNAKGIVRKSPSGLSRWDAAVIGVEARGILASAENFDPSLGVRRRQGLPHGGGNSQNPGKNQRKYRLPYHVRNPTHVPEIYSGIAAFAQDFFE